MLTLRSKMPIYGTKDRLRVSIYRSNKFISAQAINDDLGQTLLSMDTRKVKSSTIEESRKLGVEMAAKMIAKKINTIVFDRNGYRYHGKVKAFADGLREGGIKF